ncbi:MAG: cation:proton antiporter [Desulfatiglans sp.]|jgi:Kef-type K+ transport system membrane component KefB|nr:cation:proton antiporter [Thermodesulfobacteriota bacterium]MEE4353216.1 cation:proton antiporter [Desulfatiglans sp.]
MMDRNKQYIADLKTYVIAVLLLAGFALWVKRMDIGSDWQQAGMTTFSLGFVLLSAYLVAQILKITGLPLISGYIFVGILAGPFITGFLNNEMVLRLRLVDDLALSFIALVAGGSLRKTFLLSRGRAIVVNILLLSLVVFVMVGLSFYFITIRLRLIPELSSSQITVLAVLLGVIAIARSPSSAIAIIEECRAEGMFSATVLGVTVALDVLIIIFFTMALTVSKIIMGQGMPVDFQAFGILSSAVAGSLALGILFGKGISLYIEKVKHDLPLFLLFFAFSVFKISLFLNAFMETRFAVSLQLEPLLICISAGFTVQNFSRYGPVFMENLERFALPIFVLFFSLAGASLNLDALRTTWPLALFLVMVRIVGIFGSTWLAGVISGDPKPHRRIAWMAYITQAGVAIGLAQLAQRRFPELGVYLTTLVLAVITINQVAGPITFKMALRLAGEIGGKNGISQEPS